MTGLVRPVGAVMWDLRGAWASGVRISLTLDGRCAEPRIEGHVQRVSATGAFVVIAGTHVPGDAILAVHRPSRLGDSTVRAGERWRGRGHRVRPQAEALL